MIKSALDIAAYLGYLYQKRNVGSRPIPLKNQL